MRHAAVLVIGNGWSAMSAASVMSSRGTLVWVTGGSPRILPAMPTLPYAEAESVLLDELRRHGIEIGELESGSFSRLHRTRGFVKIQEEIEALWGPEKRFVAPNECRIGMDLGWLESEWRQKLAELPNVTILDDVPVKGIDVDDASGSARVDLGSGDSWTADLVVYADAWSLLEGWLRGHRKTVRMAHHWAPSGMIQAVFDHCERMGAGHFGGFVSAINKEAGEQIQRHVMGYFSADGLKSVWTSFLAPDEVEDNHLIAKKLRRMKQALNRTFVGSEWLPGGKKDFLSTVVSESVRFQAGRIFGEGEPPPNPVWIKKQFLILTDGFGPLWGFKQLKGLREAIPS